MLETSFQFGNGDNPLKCAGVEFYYAKRYLGSGRFDSTCFVVMYGTIFTIPMVATISILRNVTIWQ
jgi:hypothetical protein